jgi:hypothetical protein
VYPHKPRSSTEIRIAYSSFFLSVTPIIRGRLAASTLTIPGRSLSTLTMRGTDARLAAFVTLALGVISDQIVPNVSNLSSNTLLELPISMLKI